MSAFNIKGRCGTLGITLDDLWKEVTASDSRFQKVTYSMFCNMHRGRYDYGIGPDVISAAHAILSKKEAAQNGHGRFTQN